MSKIKYDSQSMQLMSLFERITQAKLKDSFEVGDLQVFVVQPGQIGKAVGRSGANVKKLAEQLKKKIKIIEYSPEVKVFVKNTTFPLIPDEVILDEENRIVTVVPKDTLSRGLMIGRQAIKLRETEKIIQRFFDVEEVKVSRPRDEEESERRQAAEEPTQPPENQPSHDAPETSESSVESEEENQ